MIALGFLMVVILALLQLTFLASTKHIVNFAAFIGARITMLGGKDASGEDARAVRDVLDSLDWGMRPSSWDSGNGYKVQYPTPFSLPLFNPGTGPVLVTSVVPIAKENLQIPERGDNAER